MIHPPSCLKILLQWGLIGRMVIIGIEIRLMILLSCYFLWLLHLMVKNLCLELGSQNVSVKHGIIGVLAIAVYQLLSAFRLSIATSVLIVSICSRRISVV